MSVEACISTGWFKRESQSFQWYYWTLWEKNFIWTCVDLWRVSEINLQTSLRFFCGVGWRVVLDEEWYSQKKVGYTRRIVCSQFGCCCRHKETRRSTQTKSTRPSPTSFKVQWGLRWNFRTFIFNCNKFFISV